MNAPESLPMGHMPWRARFVALLVFLLAPNCDLSRRKAAANPKDNP